MGWMDGTGMAFTVIKARPRRPQTHMGQKCHSNQYIVSQRRNSRLRQLNIGPKSPPDIAPVTSASALYVYKSHQYKKQLYANHSR